MLGYSWVEKQGKSMQVMDGRELEDLRNRTKAVLVGQVYERMCGRGVTLETVLEVTGEFQSRCVFYF